MLSFDRSTTSTSISLDIEDVNDEQGAAGGIELPDDEADARPPTAAEQPQTPKSARADSRPATAAASAAPSRPESTAPEAAPDPAPAPAPAPAPEPQDDPAPGSPAPANDADDDGDGPEESIDSILEKKVQRRL